MGRASILLVSVGLVAALLGCSTTVPDPGGDGSGGGGGGTGDGGGTLPSASLAQVATWAYQIQEISGGGAIDALAASTYDMLVVEPTRSDKSETDFDAAAMVSRLKATSGASGNRKLVVAYVDIGQAEDWRWYWASNWVAPTANTGGSPDFLVTIDPDGWSGDYPVAFWDSRWKSLMVTESNSALDQILDDGFDGIYVDWVEAYENEQVIAAAQSDGVTPAAEMVRLIGEIRTAARLRNPSFVVIQQNASGLIDEAPGILGVVDGIAQEGTWFSGSADVPWANAGAGDQATPATGDGDGTAWYAANLTRYRAAGKAVFTCDYARQSANVSKAYTESRRLGFVPYVSLTPLDRLTQTPPP